MIITGDRNCTNISKLSRRESWSLKQALERELNWAEDYRKNIKVNNLKNLDLHIEVLEKLLKELNSIWNNN